MPHSLFVVLENNVASVVTPDTQTMNQDVVFAVRSQDENYSQAVAQAICDVSNIWVFGNGTSTSLANDDYVRACGEWSHEGDLLGGGLGKSHYVYGYASAECMRTGGVDVGKIFYIGRGIGGRMLQHLDLGSDEADNPDEISKRARIRQELNIHFNDRGYTLNEARQAGLVHQIARFTGRYKSAQTDAVEKFLITHWCGVYDLTNLTRGNKSRAGGTWIVRPKKVMSTSQVWRELLSEFIHGGNQRQVQQRALLVEEIAANEPSSWQKLVDTLSVLGGITPITEGFTSDGTDAHAKFYLLDNKGKPLFVVQLRLSEREAGVCVNIRPVSGEHREFSRNIIHYFGESTSHRISVSGPSTYFKPFAYMGVSNAVDVYFNFIEPTIRHTVKHLEWLGVTEPIKMSLLDAMNKLIGQINSVQSNPQY